MRILQLSVHFKPNIGGVETHLDDLCNALVRRGFNIFVLTYRPLQTKATWKVFEEENNIKILRLPWFPNLFYQLVSYPLFEFLYLAPALFIFTPFILLLKKIEIIHAHGLIAGFVGVFWGKMFGKRVVISLHSIYHFPKRGLYRSFVNWIFNNADYILGLSRQSVKEVKSLGILSKKVVNFTYWIDLKNYQTVADAKKKLSWEGKFIVLFVGRLVEEKGIKILLEAATLWDRNIILAVVGSGPLEDEVKSIAAKVANVQFIGPKSQFELALYYSGADILIVPSTGDEGFGRVIIEALACGTPIIAARKSGIIEVMDTSVGELIDISPTDIKQAVEALFKNQNKLKKLAGNCRKFAERRYSEKNVRTIIKTYQR